MASRWSQTRASRGGGSNGIPTVIIVAVAVVMFLIGGAAGSLFSGDRSASADTDSVIAPTVKGMADAPNTQDGAVQAATSFLKGFTDLSLQDTQTRQQSTAEIISASADANLQSSLASGTAALRAQLLGDQQSTNARLIVTPLSYKASTASDGVVGVAIWYSTVLINPIGEQFSSSWSTSTMQLAFEDQWKLVGYANVDGPSPSLYAVDGQADSITDAANTLSGTFSFRSALAEPQPTTDAQ